MRCFKFEIQYTEQAIKNFIIQDIKFETKFDINWPDPNFKNIQTLLAMSNPIVTTCYGSLKFIQAHLKSYDWVIIELANISEAITKEDQSQLIRVLSKDLENQGQNEKKEKSDYKKKIIGLLKRAYKSDFAEAFWPAIMTGIITIIVWYLSCSK